MADRKITAGTSLTGANTDSANDVLVIVDVSDTTDGASGTTKKISRTELLKGPRFAKRTNVADTNYTALVTDETIAYTSLTASRTVTLPAVASSTDLEITVKDQAGAATAFNIVIDPNGSETIDGALTKSITANYGSLTFYCTGTAWFTK